MSAIAHRRKYLEFRALDGLVRRSKKLPARAAAYYALLLVCICTVCLCATNDMPFLLGARMRGMMQASFCLIAAALYCAWSGVVLLYHAVHGCIDDPIHYSLAAAIEEEEDGGGSEGALLGAHNKEDGGRRGEEEEQEEEEERVTMMPREVIVSTMYMGGLGIFLAIGPLCMWECATTLAFLASLLGIAIVDFERVPGRRASVGWALFVAVVLTLALSAAIEVMGRTSLDDLQAIFSSLGIAPSAATVVEETADPHLPLWPFLVLSGVSPVLLRAAGGGVRHGPLFHSLTPIQTLETGLPVSVLLGALLLSWFGPGEVDLLLRSPALMGSGWYWAMVFLAPTLLATTLALLLYSLRKRDTLHAVAMLAPVLVLRQRFVHSGTPSALDTPAAVMALVCLLLTLWRLDPAPPPLPSRAADVEMPPVPEGSSQQ